MSDEAYELKVKPRATQSVTINIPSDALEALQRVADGRDMSVAALMKLYIGQGLRQELAKRFGERVLESTASVLARHLASEQEVNSILREIQLESTLRE
jgi:hypothetical protein